MGNQSAAEITAQITAVTSKKDKAGREITSLQNERARLAIESVGKNKEEISKLEHQIFVLETYFKNAPAEIRLLEANLAKENQRLEQKAKDNLREQQTTVAEEIEQLSKRFIKLLTEANHTNVLLRDALSAYNGLKLKTGQEILGSYCDPSEQSLLMLLETSQARMDGIHINAVGGGIVPCGTPIRL
ncbi:unnamed protein product [marine sediment metagenome]|uniref:Uncharacterized protein n=1 Tax=marine sediment metagenome TaxID=412755 RepID=X0Y0W4_9ZZZZ